MVVAAAGNSAGRAAGSPSNCPGAIGVAALRHVGSKVGFSDIGPELAIAAPGGNCVNVGANDACLYPILTTADSGATTPQGPIYTDSFNITIGTSFSSPLVAATAALMVAVKPTLTAATVKAALQSSARPFPSSGLTDDSSGQPVPLQACRAPNNTDQLQCYCTTGTCPRRHARCKRRRGRSARHADTYTDSHTDTIADTITGTDSHTDTITRRWQ